jgi:alpha-glucosidase
VAPWWQDAVVYQIYPRSFADSDGDGVGDLEGIRGRLDYLRWLGVDAVWLSPIYPSPMADFGYDVSDYCDIDPVFGDLGTFDRLVTAAHERDIKVVLDWVPNHTSDQHPWFAQSRASRDSGKRDWYFWRDAPNNWVAAFSDDPAWTFDATTGQYYLHHFLPQQPDLNWSNPGVVAAMHDVLRFWLDRGVDGFRADVVHLIGRDPRLPDDPADRAGVSRVGFHEHPQTHELLRGIRGVLDEYPGERMMVGEINLDDSARIAAYYGHGDQLHLAFNFRPLFAPWDAAAWRDVIEDIEGAYRAAGAWPTWVLSNHDQPRHRSRYGSEERARAAAVLLLSLRGTPFLYAGEELGLSDAVVPPDRVVDPGGRDGCRAPMPWDAAPDHGWGSVDPWLPWPPAPASRNVDSLQADPASILHRYRRLLTVRRSSVALRRGGLSLLTVPEGVLGFVRATPDEAAAVLVNFTDDHRDVALDRAWTVTVASDGLGEGSAFSGRLGPSQAVVLGPA